MGAQNVNDPATECVETLSAAETIDFGRALAKRLSAGDCVALIGDLGAGKTVLARGIAKGLGLEDERLVSSPTYVLVHEYDAPVTIYHIDLYRMGAPDEELSDLGLDEMLAGGVVLIEWADRVRNMLPADRWEIRIELTGPEKRRVTLRRVR